VLNQNSSRRRPGRLSDGASHRRWARRAVAGALSMIVILGISAPSASASAAHHINHQAISQCPRNAWSALAPAQCGSSTNAIISPRAGYGYGCGGYYTGTGHPWMTCKGSAIDTHSVAVVIRHGYYNPAANPEGFGWSKALGKHNLWIQAIVDAIDNSLHITGGRSAEDYTVYHYNPDGYIDQTVTVVADNVATSFAGNSTQDKQPVGVTTGYCTPGVGDPIEEQCPQ
jgi:uncharacterized low-complexity protein